MLGPPKGTPDLYFDEKRTEGAVLRGWVSILPVSERKRPKISIKHRKLGSYVSYMYDKFHMFPFDSKKIIIKPRLTFFSLELIKFLVWMLKCAESLPVFPMKT